MAILCCQMHNLSSFLHPTTPKMRLCNMRSKWGVCISSKNFKSFEIIKSQNEVRFFNTAKFLMQAFLWDRLAKAREKLSTEPSYIYTFPQTFPFLFNLQAAKYFRHSKSQLTRCVTSGHYPGYFKGQFHNCWTVTTVRGLYQFLQSDRFSDNCQISVWKFLGLSLYHTEIKSIVF